MASRRLAGDSDAAPSRRSRLTALVVLGVLPAVVLILSGVVGFLKWNFDNAREARTAAVESIQAASDSTVKMLSYQPSTVEQDLASAEDGMTGVFRDEYVKLTHDVVIPGAKEKNIAAVAKVAAASSVSATGDHAVVLVFVNQTVTVGSDPPTNTASSVRVTVNKHGNRWLISAFEPV
ncbi:hypothetical protein BA059_22735 [Mycolicibacterium sp. (ex Dasyatis americana)]|nr:hypothetical protein BA059_22735 [Mycolicibacterium sp. (ex Dasyatis americana)]